MGLLSPSHMLAGLSGLRSVSTFRGRESQKLYDSQSLARHSFCGAKQMQGPKSEGTETLLELLRYTQPDGRETRIQSRVAGLDEMSRRKGEPMDCH